MSNTHDFVLNESIYFENSHSFNSEIDYMDKNVPTNVMNIPMMEQKYNFVHVT